MTRFSWRKIVSETFWVSDIERDFALIKRVASGVADGVGGWREHGIDPSLFSSSLMEACRSLIDNKLIDLNPLTLKELLSKGYQQLLEDKQCIIGERSLLCSSPSHAGVSYRKQYGMYGGLAQREEHSTHCKSG